MDKKSKEELLGIIKDHQKQIKGFGVRRCGIFGSVVRNKHTGHSDIDVLVEFEPSQKTFDNFMRLAEFLEQLFGRKVDLVTVDSLSPYIGPHILQDVEYAALGT